MRNLLRRLFLSLGAFLLAAPVFLLAGGAVLRDPRPLLWLLPLACAAALPFFVRLLPGKGRLPGLILSMALSAACALYLGGVRHIGALAWIPAALAALAAAAHMALLSGWQRENIALWYVGMAVYVFSRLICTLTRQTALYAPLRVLTLAYAVYAVFALAFQSLRDGTGGSRTPSCRMVLRGVGGAVLLSALLLALTHLPQLFEALRAAVRGVVEAVVWLVSRLGEMNMARGGGGGGGDAGLPGVEAAEPSAFLVFLEQVLKVVAAAALLVIAALLLRLAVRGLIRAFRALARRLRAYAGQVTNAYEDTVESLLDWGDVRRAVREHREKRREDREKRVPWQQLSARQQVRRSYQVYLSRHPDVPPGRTARQEIGRRDLAEIYEAARYSDREITPAEAEMSREMQKK